MKPVTKSNMLMRIVIGKNTLPSIRPMDPANFMIALNGPPVANFTIDLKILDSFAKKAFFPPNTF